MFSHRFVCSAFVLLGLLYLATSVPAIAHAAASADFIITVRTDNPGSSSSTQFTIPTTGSGYNYNVDCNDDGTNEATAQTGNYTCSYGVPGTYTARIKDNTGAGTGFPRIFFNNGGDAPKLLTINQWGTGKWTSMAAAFAGCWNMNGAASDSPDLSNVSDMSAMFETASAFDQNIGNWNTAHVTDMGRMFEGAGSFNQKIGNWNTAHVTDMSAMFYYALAFNQKIGSWKTAHVTDMSAMFDGAGAFNKNIGSWNTAKVTDMSAMFEGASAFNRSIGGWDTANVTNMSYMFANAYAFNENIGSWNTANVTDMSRMFYYAHAFNQNLRSWNTANVTNMSRMFYDAYAFNQNIGSWNTAQVFDTDEMFAYAGSFDQNIGTWNVSALSHASNMFGSVKLSTANYDALLNGWNAQTLQNYVSFGGGNSQYCAGEAARSHMLAADNWSITDGGKHCASADLQITKTVKKLSPTNHQYVVRVGNMGADPALSVTVTDKLPKPYTISSITSKTAHCQKNGRTVTCTLARLNLGATLKITILATPHGANGQNCATVQAGTPDPNTTNNKSCVVVPQ